MEAQASEKYGTSKFSSDDEEDIEREPVSEDEFHSMHNGFDENSKSSGDDPVSFQEQTFNGANPNDTSLKD